MRRRMLNVSTIPPESPFADQQGYEQAKDPGVEPQGLSNRFRTRRFKLFHLAGKKFRSESGQFNESAARTFGRFFEKGRVGCRVFHLQIDVSDIEGANILKFS